MTATWDLVSNEDEPHVRLSFYTGPAAKPPNYTVYRVATSDSDSKFNNHYDADEYAATLGVECWRLIHHNRSHPFAATIPIIFDGAPNKECLDEMVERFSNGETLKQLAEDLQRIENTNVHPMMLRIWMLGCQPQNSALTGLLPRN